MSRLDCLYLSAKQKLGKNGERIRDFFASQDGRIRVSMIITIVVLLIFVALLVLFWNWLSEWVENQMCTIPPRLPEPSMY